MIDHIIEQRLSIGRPRPVVFAFFADPRQAVHLTPPWLRVSLMSGPAHRQAGAVLDYRLRCFGVVLTMRCFVREFDAPFRLLEVQVRGPFARWEHRRRFLSASETSTVMEDRVVYRFPFGLVGRVVHLVVGRYLVAAVLGYRTRRIGELLGPVSASDN